MRSHNQVFTNPPDENMPGVQQSWNSPLPKGEGPGVGWARAAPRVTHYSIAEEFRKKQHGRVSQGPASELEGNNHGVRDEK
jgi:hypothetical protein